MYPTVSDFLREVLGINIPLPIQTYGFFIGMAYLVAIYILSLEFKRREKLNLFGKLSKRVLVGEPAKPFELIISGLVGFLVGFKLLEMVLNYSDFVNNTQDFVLSARGNWIGGIVGGILAVYMKYREKNKQKLEKPRWETHEILPHELAGNILMVAVVFGLLGAKIFHNLENFDELLKNPIESLLSFSGLTFFGGLIGGTTAVVLYARKYKFDLLQLIDSGAPAVAMGYGIGRLGCQFSGDGCWGVVNNLPKPGWMSFLPDWLWSYNFPHNVINAGKTIENCDGKHCHILDQPVFPTSFYEFLMMAAIFLILWNIRKHIKIPGLLFCIYLILAGLERLTIESIRVNNLFHVGSFSFTQAQMIAVVLFILGTTGGYLLYKKHKSTETKILK
jgi:phosphatidylglycerol---prolipoprotein diacylglyceryl transferase